MGGLNDESTGMDERCKNREAARLIIAKLQFRNNVLASYVLYFRLMCYEHFAPFLGRGLIRRDLLHTFMVDLLIRYGDPTDKRGALQNRAVYPQWSSCAGS